MALAPGSRVGHYRIVGSLGAGGMGEVYRAHDTKLGREVALKVLPDLLSSDAERRARFAREARALAALNHPNIAQIHGFEDGEPSALIMELVEGEDLSQRIRRGPIAYEEAIAIARQIAEALQAAHDRGIIHRDLKPANIKLREDGTVKVLDFGLAKALDQGSGIGEQGSGDISHSPTITSPAMTLRGVILGTAAYMAPEQAKGRVIDKRADIWAFGCVLYEMLTGRKAFAGEDVSDTLASILKSDVDCTGVSPRATRLLKKCLEKDPRKRLHDVGDAWDLLDDAAPSAAGALGRSQWLPWSLAALFAVSTIGIASLRFFDAPLAPPPTARFQIEPPAKECFNIYLSLSPDGRRIAFTAAADSGPPALWVRNLESLEARKLPGTDNASSPFWSPDGQFIAFGDGNTLKKIDVFGGPPQKVAEMPTVAGSGAWSRDGVIVIGTRGLGPLFRLPATGGTPTPLTQLNEKNGERGHSFPHFLPDQKRVLYIRLGTPETEGIYVASIDRTPQQQEESRIAPATLGPLALIEHGRGHRLLFVRDGTLIAQRFDADRAQLSGDTQPVAEQIGRAGSFAYFGAAGDVLAFRNLTSAPASAEQLSWNDRSGKELEKIGQPVPLASGPNSIAISPDGKRAALMLGVAQILNVDLWLVEFERGLVTRLTASQGSEAAPVWSPDSRRLVFRSSRTANFSFDLFWKEADGNAEATSVTPTPTLALPGDWSRDGRYILFTRARDAINSDILALSVDRRAADPLLETPFFESSPRLSADGRWMAYVSSESGQNEVYLRPFIVAADGKPSVGAKWRVSTGGGAAPHWRADGKELLFRSAAGDFLAVDVKATGETIQTSLPRRLFPTIAGVHAWDVTADGQRFLIATPLRSISAPASDPVTVVLNWKSTLK